MVFMQKAVHLKPNSWAQSAENLTSKNKVSGPFTTKNEEGLGLSTRDNYIIESTDEVLLEFLQSPVHI